MIAMIMSGLAFALHANTLIDWWIPLSICLPLAMPSGFLLKGFMRRITDLKNPVWNILAGIIFSFAVLIGSFYTLNYYFSDETTESECTVTVVKKFSEEHYHTRRISRNRVIRGNKYRVYYMNVELQNGKVKKLEIPLSKFNKIKKGAPLILPTQTGLFGIPVLKTR